MLRRTFLFSSSLVPLAAQEKPKRKLDVPYVPSTEVAVKEMLKMAKIQKGDVLYDLGCGDGRIVIAAEEQARAVEQVNVTVMEMDRVVRENAAGAERSAHAAEEVRLRAEDVEGTVAGLVRLVGTGARR